MQKWGGATVYRETVTLDVCIDEQRLRQIAGKQDRYLCDGIAEVELTHPSGGKGSTRVVLEACTQSELEKHAAALELVEREIQQAEHLAWVQGVLRGEGDLAQKVAELDAARQEDESRLGSMDTFTSKLAIEQRQLRNQLAQLIEREENLAKAYWSHLGAYHHLLPAQEGEEPEGEKD